MSNTSREQWRRTSVQTYIQKRVSWPVFRLTYEGEFFTHRRMPSRKEAEDLEGVIHVKQEEGLSHYYQGCPAGHNSGLAHALTDTTCPACLQIRAEELSGPRWTHPLNAAEVTYLKLMMGPEINLVALAPVKT